MPTTIYCRGQFTSNSVYNARTPRNFTTTWGADKHSGGAVLVNNLETATGSSIGTVAMATIAGTPSGPGIFGSADSSSAGGPPEVWLSYPVSSQVTISGTVAMDLWGTESAMTANVGMAGSLWVIRVDGTESLIISLKNGTTEVGTSTTQVSMSGTPTSTTLYPGDVLAFAPAFVAVGTMASGNTMTFSYDGAEGANNDSQIRLTETVSFNTATPTGSIVKMQGTASDLSGKRRAWTDAGSETTFTVNTAASPTQPQWTESAGGAVAEWITPPLQAVTVTGRMYTQTRSWVSSILAQNGIVFKIYKTATDGTGHVQIGQAHHPDISSTASPGNASGFYGHINGTIAQGERIAIRAYATSNWAAGGGNQASGYTASIMLDRSAGGPTYIELPATLTLAPTGSTGSAAGVGSISSAKSGISATDATGPGVGAVTSTSAVRPGTVTTAGVGATSGSGTSAFVATASVAGVGAISSAKSGIRATDATGPGVGAVTSTSAVRPGVVAVVGAGQTTGQGPGNSGSATGAGSVTSTSEIRTFTNRGGSGSVTSTSQIRPTKATGPGVGSVTTTSQIRVTAVAVVGAGAVTGTGTGTLVGTASTVGAGSVTARLGLGIKASVTGTGAVTGIPTLGTNIPATIYARSGNQWVLAAARVYVGGSWQTAAVRLRQGNTWSDLI